MSIHAYYIGFLTYTKIELYDLTVCIAAYGKTFKSPQ